METKVIALKLSTYDELKENERKLKDSENELEELKKFYDDLNQDYHELFDVSVELGLWLVVYRYKYHHPYETLADGEFVTEYFEQTFNALVKEHNVPRHKALAKLQYMEEKGI